MTLFEHTMRLVRGAFLGLLCSTAWHEARAQELPADVRSVLQHRVGTWDVRNDVLGPDGTVARVTSERHEVTVAINGDIVEIRGFIEGHEDFRSFYFFNPLLGRYVYSTIDRTNNLVVSTAERDVPYRLTSNPFRVPGGATVVFRTVFTSVTPDRMEGYGEISADDGATWRRVFNQVRTRIRRDGSTTGARHN